MFDILRDEESGICMDGSFVAAGSQVWLYCGSSNAPHPFEEQHHHLYINLAIYHLLQMIEV